jgi:hypothetical protein
MNFRRSGTRSLISPNISVLAGLFLLGVTAGAQHSPQSVTTDTVNVREFGAVGDAKTDDTAAFQKALTRSAKSAAAPIRAARQLPLRRRLNVPNAVTLAGLWTSVPATTACGMPACPAHRRRHHVSGHRRGRAGGRSRLHHPQHHSTLKGVVCTIPPRTQTPSRRPTPGPSPCGARTPR